MHEVTRIVAFEFSDNYSGIQQNSTCNVESALKRKMHVDLDRLYLQYFFHTNHLLNVSLKRKTDNISTLVRHMIAAEAASWPATAIRIAYVARLHRSPIVECQRPK